MVIKAPPQALFFDVFGTCVDWRGTVTNALQATARDRLHDATASLPSKLRLFVSDLTMDQWGQFAADWRHTYYEFTRAVAAHSGLPFKTVDEHYYDSLKDLLEKWDLSNLYDDDQVRSLSLIWHYLDPWPDSVDGVVELNRLASTATLSNGNISLLSDLRTHSGIPFTHVLSAEMFGTYKPNAKVYLGACEKLSLPPGDCAMVAAHLGDLQAAKANGLQTIYVERPREESWDASRVEQAKKEGFVDLWIAADQGGFTGVAKRLLDVA